ncbi:MAG: cell division protein FtsQ/DivIB [Actinomycetales bacterium]|nr:cell division protein FtsQ/DivIB [Actinomycetales bacterium]
MTVSVLAQARSPRTGHSSSRSRAAAARRPPSERVVRRRASRRRRWLIAVCGFLILAAIGTGAWWLTWRSEFLAVQSVRVEGVSGKERQIVLGAAAVPLGTAMVQVPGSAIQSRVESIAWIRTAIVRLQWPSGVVVEVEPRQSLAQDAGTGWAVDADGTVFQPPEPVPRGLPVIRASDAGRVQAMRVLADLPRELVGRISAVSASTRDDIRFSLRSGALVRWGSDEQGPLKAEVLGALLSRRALVYDVSAPLAPTTRGERLGRRRPSS